MTLQPLWWCLLIATLGLLGYSFSRYLRHRRRGVPIPTYAAGNVSGGLASVLMIVSLILDMNGMAARLALGGGVVLLGISAALFISARRRLTGAR